MGLIVHSSFLGGAFGGSGLMRVTCCPPPAPFRILFGLCHDQIIKSFPSSGCFVLTPQWRSALHSVA